VVERSVTTGTNGEIHSQPRRGDGCDLGLSPLRGWEMFSIASGGFSTGLYPASLRDEE